MTSVNFRTKFFHHFSQIFAIFTGGVCWRHNAREDGRRRELLGGSHIWISRPLCVRDEKSATRLSCDEFFPIWSQFYSAKMPDLRHHFLKITKQLTFSFWLLFINHHKILKRKLAMWTVRRWVYFRMKLSVLSFGLFSV